MVNKNRKIRNSQSYLSIPEAAKLLGISRIALYQKVKSGQIKARRIGRNYAVSKSALGVSVVGKHEQIIERAVKKALREYGEVIKRLKDE